MPTDVIPFGVNLESGNAQLAGAPPVAYNVVADGRGAIRKRPIMRLWEGFWSGVTENYVESGWSVDGISSLGDSTLVVVTGRRTIYRIDGGVLTALTDGTASSLLDGTARPTFAETRSRLVIAGGGAPQKVEPAAVVSARLGGSPPNCTHVAAMASRLFVDDNTAGATYEGRLRHSGTGATGEETWDALDTFDTEAQPDDCLAVHTDSSELWTFGSKTLQIYQPDPYSIVAARIAKRMGCAAPYSVIAFDNQFAWLNHKREFVVSDGRSSTSISAGIDTTLDDLDTVSDCFGFRIVTGQYEILVWVFPTERRTFAWQVGGGWSEWAGWTDGLGYTPLDVTAGFYWEDQNLNIIGASDGQILEWSTAGTSDFAGNPAIVTLFNSRTVKAEVQTGFLDRGTSATKVCDAVRITLKGQSTGSKVRLSWRDDLGSFVAPLEFSLAGDSTVVEVRGLGTYRTRQWSLDMSDEATLEVAKVEEDFTVV